MYKEIHPLRLSRSTGVHPHADAGASRAGVVPRRDILQHHQAGPTLGIRNGLWDHRHQHRLSGNHRGCWENKKRWGEKRGWDVCFACLSCLTTVHALHSQVLSTPILSTPLFMFATSRVRWAPPSLTKGGKHLFVVPCL